MPALFGIQQETATTDGWLQAGVDAAVCWCCELPARYFKPGINLVRVWWCPPCETTWLSGL